MKLLNPQKQKPCQSTWISKVKQLDSLSTLIDCRTATRIVIMSNDNGRTTFCSLLPYVVVKLVLFMSQEGQVKKALQSRVDVEASSFRESEGQVLQLRKLDFPEILGAQAQLTPSGVGAFRDATRLELKARTFSYFTFFYEFFCFFILCHTYASAGRAGG